MRPNAAAVLLASLALALAAALITPRYGTPDDGALAMMATGAGYAATASDALFPLFPYVPGRALVALYHAAPGVPWYALYLLAAYWLVFFCLFRALLVAPAPSRPLRLLLGGALLVYFLLHEFTVLTFTVCGLLLAVAGAALFYAQPSLAVFAGAVAGAASFLRVETGYLGLFAVLPMVAATRAWRPAARFVLAALVVIAASAVPDYIGFARDAGWASQRQTYRELIRLFDYGAADPAGTGSEHLRAVGWSDEDYALVTNNFVVTGDVFDVDKMRRARRDAPVVAGRKLERARWAIEGVLASSFVRRLVVFSVAALLLLGATRAGAGLVAAQAAFLFALFFGMGALMKLPERIYEPLALAIGFLAVLAPVRQSAFRERRWLRGHVLTGACALLALASVSKLYAWSRYQNPRATTAEMKSAVEALAPKPDELFLAWSSFGELDLSAYADTREVFRGLKILDVGAALADSPYGRRRRDEFRIDDLYRAPFERKDVFLLSNPTRNEAYRNFVRRRYGVELEIEKRFQCRFFTVYRATRLPSAGTGLVRAGANGG